MIWVFVTSTGFFIECVPAQAASVFAFGGLLRNPAAAEAAVVIQPLTERMGLGWCFVGLRLTDLFVIGGAVFLLLQKSPAWRRESNAAATKRRDQLENKSMGKG